MEKVTVAELKRRNRSSIFRLIYSEKKTSRQSITERLQLSLPTVNGNLRELEAMGLVERNGYFASSGGRKPEAICCVSRSRVAFGVEMTTRHLYLACVDLYGDVLRESRLRIDFADTPAYYKQMGGLVCEFIAGMRVSAKKILGVGIALQGLVSADGQTVTYGEIMHCTGARLEQVAAHIPYPCRLLHDSESAAFAEIWFSDDIGDAVYINLSNKLGGALILDAAIYRGKGAGSGLVEHMIVEPGGAPCYCGKRGCLDAYCSVEALCGDESGMDAFFADLRLGRPEQCAQWGAYLGTLAGALDNLHMLIDCDVILGGSMASYLTEEDAVRLNDLARERCAFAVTQPYIRLSACKANVMALGAALVYVREFLDAV